MRSHLEVIVFYKFTNCHSLEICLGYMILAFIFIVRVFFLNEKLMEIERVNEWQQHLFIYYTIR